jgi:hypothetical protein
VHDDVAPAAPDTTRIHGTGPGICLVRGAVAVSGAMMSVEARTTIRVVSVATSATVSTTANDGGAWSVNVNACPGDMMRITATDAAGNTSAISMITIE